MLVCLTRVIQLGNSNRVVYLAANLAVMCLHHSLHAVTLRVEELSRVLRPKVKVMATASPLKLLRERADVARAGSYLAKGARSGYLVQDTGCRDSVCERCLLET